MNTLMKSDKAFGIMVAVALFAVWTAATWFFEGRIETFLRPDDVTDRLVYAVVANLVIGTLGAVILVRWLGGYGLSLADAGFGTPQRTLVSVLAGAVLGFGLYVVQGAPTLDPMIMLNAYAQVFVVSAAEVLVCWALVGATIASGLEERGLVVGAVAAGVVASVLFGLYHYAHSAPFNTLEMVGLLMVVGLVTSLFFFVSRDVYGTIVFHNFLGTYGVAQALKASGQLESFSTFQPQLLTMALVTLAVLVAADYFWLRRPPATTASAGGMTLKHG